MPHLLLLLLLLLLIWVKAGEVHPRTGHEDTKEAVAVRIYSFFNIGTGFSGWSSPRPDRFDPRGKRPGTHCTGDRVGPRPGLDRCRNSRLYRDSMPGRSASIIIIINLGKSK